MVSNVSHVSVTHMKEKPDGDKLNANMDNDYAMSVILKA